VVIEMRFLKGYRTPSMVQSLISKDWWDVEEGVAVDFTLDRALELQARQPRKDRQRGVGDGYFTGESGG
jgi:hypothetical protein